MLEELLEIRDGPETVEGETIVVDQFVTVVMGGLVVWMFVALVGMDNLYVCE